MKSLFLTLALMLSFSTICVSAECEIHSVDNISFEDDNGNCRVTFNITVTVDPIAYSIAVVHNGGYGIALSGGGTGAQQSFTNIGATLSYTSNTCDINELFYFRVQEYNSGNLICQQIIDLSEAMPVELTSFTGHPQTAGIDLHWETASEAQNSHFEIERSDGGLHFEQVGQVMGNGDSQTPHQYSFSHSTPSAGINYYRLRQVDFDGQSSYSPAIAVAFQGTGRAIDLYPTVAQDALYLNWSGRAAKRSTFSVFNSAGKLMLSNALLPEARRQEIAIGGLIPGMYWIRVHCEGGKTEIRRFIKL